VKRAGLLVLLVASGLLFLGACGNKRGLEDPEAVLAMHLDRVDLAWGQRGSGGYSAVHEALTRAEISRPGHPEIAWRWARYQVGLGLSAADVDTARHAYSAGRRAGLACLLSDPVFASRDAELGWRPAVDALREDRQACALWTAFAWLRWMEHIGAGAAEVDLVRIRVLLEHLDAKGVNPDGRTTWSRGLVQVLTDRARGLTSPRGRALLERAADTAPRDLSRVSDLLILGQTEIAGASRSRLEQVLRYPPANPEDARALQRLQEL
jgi:hypothetical protein